MSKLFEGEVVLVTGSGRRNGIGYGIARLMVELGASVVVTDVCKRSRPDRDYEDQAWRELSAIADEFKGLGGRHLAMKADLSIPKEIESLFDHIEKSLGTVSILVNNAGICIVKPLLDTSLGEWETTMTINTTSVFLCSTEAARRMINKHIKGSIINISSISGKEGWPDFGAYTASKFAILGFTQTFARELARQGIRVNAVCPGLIATGMNDINLELLAKVRNTSPEEIDRSQRERVPLGRYGTPRDIARVVAFLASQEANYMTGQSINVTGGLMVH